MTLIQKKSKLFLMTNNDRNARTLVICFVLAVMSLTALKFVEVGQNIEMISNSQVLGETTQKNEIILPNAEIQPAMMETGSGR